MTVLSKTIFECTSLTPNKDRQLKYFSKSTKQAVNQYFGEMYGTYLEFRHSEVRVWLGLTVGWGCQKRNQWSIFLVLAANTVRIMDVLPAGAKVMSAMMYPFPNK